MRYWRPRSIAHAVWQFSFSSISRSRSKQRRLELRGSLTPKPKVSPLDLNSCACTARTMVRVSRYLLILSALSLLTMPITEHLWNWDRFLQTGRDFELGTLMVLSFFCLVLILSRKCKQRVESLFAAWCTLAFKFMDQVTPGFCLPGMFLVFCTEPVTRPGTGVYGFPLQI